MAVTELKFAYKCTRTRVALRGWVVMKGKKSGISADDVAFLAASRDSVVRHTSCMPLNRTVLVLPNSIKNQLFTITSDVCHIQRKKIFLTDEHSSRVYMYTAWQAG
jgi:hypothetical protein